MASVTDMTELASSVEAIFPAAAPWTNLHSLRDGFVTFDTSEQYGKNPFVFFNERFPPDFSPIRLLFRGLSGNERLQVFGQRFSKCGEHFSRVCESVLRIDRQGFFHESDECDTGSFAKSFVAFVRPVERPSRQDAGNVLVENQSYCETIASISRVAVGLLRGDVTGRSEIIDRFDPAFDLEGYSEIPDCSPLVGKEKYIRRRDVTMYDALLVGKGQTLKDLHYY